MAIDSNKVKAGPEDLMEKNSGKYFNYSDKNKVNIEIIVIGGAASGS